MVAILYAKRGSVYFDIPGLDVWDECRDARLFPGGVPVVAHPPCRAWGRFAHKAKAEPHERDLAFHALGAVRENGGVLEHPNGSQLWRVAGLPRPGEPPDGFGGFSVLVNQVDWGHRALKPTLLYCVRTNPHALVRRPPSGVPVTTVERMWRGEREATPLPFAMWLVHLANGTHIPCPNMHLVTRE